MTPAPARPWYVATLLTAAAWTAGLAVAAALALAVEAAGAAHLTLAIIGAAVALGAAAASRRLGNPFLCECADALTLGGAFAAVAGVGVLRGLDAAAIAAASATLVLYPLARAASVRFLLAAATLILSALALENHLPTDAFDLMAVVTLPAGLALTLAPPPRLDLRPAALALLLAVPLLSALSFGSAAVTRGGGLLGLMALALVGVLLLLMRRQLTPAALAVLGLGAAVSAWALPVGGTSALLILMLGWAMGARGLAVTGSLLAAFFLVRYYFAIEFTLMDKAAILAVVGVALGAGWWATGREARQ